VTTTITPLERNRVGVNFAVVEGDIAKIKQINIIGAARIQRIRPARSDGRCARRAG
jgi:outer membrane protein assembly factor BamA